MDPFCLLSFIFVFVILCSLVVTCLEKPNLLTLLCVMFPRVFVTFSYVSWSTSELWMWCGADKAF